MINKDDKPHDDLSPELWLPYPQFYIYDSYIIDKWKEKQIENVVNTSPLDFGDDLFY